MLYIIIFKKEICEFKLNKVISLNSLSINIKIVLQIMEYYENNKLIELNTSEKSHYCLLDN